MFINIVTCFFCLFVFLPLEMANVHTLSLYPTHFILRGQPHFLVLSGFCTTYLYVPPMSIKPNFLEARLTLQFSSVTQPCLTLCGPMDCIMPGFPIHHQLPNATQNSYQSRRWCHPTISSSVAPFSFCLQSFPASGTFPVSQFFTSGDQSIGVSASAPVLPMNIQDWFPLGLTS